MGNRFWNTQPVGKNRENGVINMSMTAISQVTELPFDLKWESINNVKKISKFLRKYYVEDVSSSYRLCYSNSFIEFLIDYPLHKPEYSLGMLKNNKLIGYILGREHLVRINNDKIKMLSVNFLCLNKKYRKRNLAPLLITELTRIANQNGVFQAVFTSEKSYGFSFCSAHYFHYPINIENLVLAELINKNFKSSQNLTFRKNTRLASIEDLDKIHSIYREKVERSQIFEYFDRSMFLFNFQNRNNVMRIVYNEESIEFASFYIVNTYCIEKNLEIKRAYLYYWSGSTDIIVDAIEMARHLNIDMFDLIDVGDNKKVIRKLGFGEGTGILKYHFFGYDKTPVSGSDIDFILF